MNKIVALVRVSTDKQTVENQEFAIKKAYPNAEIIWFREDDTSGAKKFKNRPGLELWSDFGKLEAKLKSEAQPDNE